MAGAVKRALLLVSMASVNKTPHSKERAIPAGGAG